MLNKIYYVKQSGNDFISAIKTGLLQAFALIQSKQYSNIKLVLPNASLINSVPNSISDAFEQIFKGHGSDIGKSFKKNRAYSFSGIFKPGERIGISILLANNNYTFNDEHTVVVLVYANEKILAKLQNELAFTSIDLVAIVHQPTASLNEMLSASRAIKSGSHPDPDVIPYQGGFNSPVLDIISKLKSINTTDGGANHYTLDLFKEVIISLKNARLAVAFVDFLGFLVNDVSFPLGDSLELLHSQRKYFNR